MVRGLGVGVDVKWHKKVDNNRNVYKTSMKMKMATMEINEIDEEVGLRGGGGGHIQETNGVRRF